MRSYFVYIMASRSRRPYTGVTRDLRSRVWQHRDGQCNHTRKYRIHRLVYFDRFSTPADAIAAEKRIKDWTRAKRVALIESLNPLWRDFAEGWLGKTARHPERSVCHPERSEGSREEQP